MKVCQTKNDAPDHYSPFFAPLWPSRGFWGFCWYEIRRGLKIRHWITLPAMWRREQRFRRELTECLNGHNAEMSGGR